MPSLETWINKLVLIGILVSVSSCMFWQAGGDPYGKKLLAQSAPVLVATIEFNKDKGHYPTALQELVPNYLPVIPVEPKLRFDDYSGYISFIYTPTWPQSGQIECRAKFGDTAFNCLGYL
jgi:hypothetical protein